MKNEENWVVGRKVVRNKLYKCTIVWRKLSKGTCIWRKKNKKVKCTKRNILISKKEKNRQNVIF